MSNIAVSLKNIDFAYDKKQIYKGFSVDVNTNDIFFIMGINGCGKTTLLKIICSFLPVSNGNVSIDGKDIKQLDSKSFSRIVSYVPQTINLSSDFLVKDYLAMGRTPYKKFYSTIDEFDYQMVEKYAREFEIENLLGFNFNSLSGGQKQLVAICRAFIQETPIVVMDEPMSALDLGKQAEILSLLLRLKEQGKTIILTSHNPNHALAIKEYSKTCLLDNGSILACGNSTDVLTKENFERIFGNKIHLDTNSNSIMFNVLKEENTYGT